jgi:hypothetical protein
MKSKKPTPPAKPEEETQGTRWAAEIRAECNNLSDEERERLLAAAMRIIYADVPKPAPTRRR